MTERKVDHSPHPLVVEGLSSRQGLLRALERVSESECEKLASLVLEMEHGNLHHHSGLGGIKVRAGCPEHCWACDIVNLALKIRGCSSMEEHRISNPIDAGSSPVGPSII